MKSKFFAISLIVAALCGCETRVLSAGDDFLNQPAPSADASVSQDTTGGRNDVSQPDAVTPTTEDIVAETDTIIGTDAAIAQSDTAVGTNPCAACGAGTTCLDLNGNDGIKDTCVPLTPATPDTGSSQDTADTMVGTDASAQTDAGSPGTDAVAFNVCASCGAGTTCLDLVGNDGVKDTCVPVLPAPDAGSTQDTADTTIGTDAAVQTDTVAMSDTAVIDPCTACGAGTICLDLDNDSVKDTCVPLTTVTPDAGSSQDTADTMVGTDAVAQSDIDAGTDAVATSDVDAPQPDAGTPGTDAEIGTDASCTPYLQYQDNDKDGYGNINVSVLSCTPQSGHVSNMLDCDDSNAAVNPTTEESCDGIDNNCNGETDEGKLFLFYCDVDGDGYGDAKNPVMACGHPSGYAPIGTDCNDNNATIHPAASEPDDGIDNNCNGVTDENAPVPVFCQDLDEDGNGNHLKCVSVKTKPAGYVAYTTDTKGDCNDNDASVFSGAAEVCNNVDDDCDGETDEACKNFNSITLTFPKLGDNYDLDVFYEVYTSAATIESQWDGWLAAEATNTVMVSFDSSINPWKPACGVRVSVTITDKKTGAETWLCVGNGKKATIYPGVLLDLDWFGMDFTEADVEFQPWASPSGGCSLIFAHSQEGVCAFD